MTNKTKYCTECNARIGKQLISKDCNEICSNCDKGKMDNFTAIGIAEGFIQPDNEEQLIQAWQHLLDTGKVWTMQGFFGRTAQTLIDEGVIYE